ncbi:MAG: hypothetical protein E7271_04195 [Lachnospiraceae bacterium]|nr:hypothetical protein [Lachnospiraceae bacterium]
MVLIKKDITLRLFVCFLIGLFTLCIGTISSSKVVFANSSVVINETNFPDPIFRKVISGRDYDRDGNGTLDSKEIGLTINIYCEGMGIKSLKGVEYFTDLQGLWCMDNEIESLDISNNKDLRGLWCSGNKLTSLDLTPNPELLWVYCYDCKLTSLNVSNNPKMAFIECNTNPLKTLDVSHNPELEHLTCGTCELSSLDVSNNPKLAHLDAFRNELKTLDVTHNPKLKRLDIWDNPGLGSIDISKNQGLQFYNCANNGATSINVKSNPELQKLICSYNQIKELDVTSNPKLVYLDCAVNKIAKLDISKNIKLYFLQAFTNRFTSLDIGYNPFLVKTYKEGVKKSEAAVCKGHSWTIEFGGETSTGEDNIYFLCFDDAVKLSSKLKAKTPVRAKAVIPKGVSQSDLITRELAIYTLYKLEGCPSVGKEKSKFKDVIKGEWYENAIIWGEKNKICIGYPDISSDTFGVGEMIERQDLALMLMRYSEFKNYKRSIDFGRADDFIDYYDIDYYAWEAVTWAATWQIMIGKGKVDAPKEERKIEPHVAATRKDFEEMLTRLFEVNNVNAKVSIPQVSGTEKYISIKKVKQSQLTAGLNISDKKTFGKYKITKFTKKAGKKTGGTVTYMGPYNKKCTKVTIPKTVKICGVKYKVTVINEKAFVGCKKLAKVIIGENVTRIGKEAFSGCGKLKKIVVKTKKLKGVGKNAFKGINPKAKFAFPKKKRKVYKKYKWRN